MYLKEESHSFASEKDVQKFVVAAILDVDQAEVIAGLGKQGGRGQARLREICVWPDGFRTHISDTADWRQSLSFQKVLDSITASSSRYHLSNVHNELLLDLLHRQ